MVDMTKFTLTKHDDELLAIIRPVINHSHEHQILARWAIDCLARVLPKFRSRYPKEVILDRAVDTLELWIDDKIKMWDARKYTFTVLLLARDMAKFDQPYSHIVRAASHCLATCHVPNHAERVAMYVVSAIKHINGDNEQMIQLMENERRWQIEHLNTLMSDRTLSQPT